MLGAAWLDDDGVDRFDNDPSDDGTDGDAAEDD
jgi:hypothetical protein